MKPDFLFETSWEVCNKVGGIHTVISTKALNIINELGNNYILIGPDVWREDIRNPEFIPDETLFAPWKAIAANDGLRVKTGRWDIAGKPIVILLDFTPYFGQQNEIFAKFWETYKLDSISGQWDYVEPALFGYAAGKLIASFTSFYRESQAVVAQFHEWMTGTGVLYLKEHAPWVATSFTTHATVLGRSVAGNSRPLYSSMKQYVPAQVARDFNVSAKQSLERLSAFEADVFTTVSGITSKECAHFLGKEVNYVTPNGFEDSFVPPASDFKQKRDAARQKLLSVAEAVLGYAPASDSVLVANSGRYEFRNKGIDIFIDALGSLNRDRKAGKEIIAFILIPAYHSGPRAEIVNALNDKSAKNTGDRYLTHGLHFPGSDPVLARLVKNDLNNNEESVVKVIFVPSYLNGDDGVFGMSYFDILIGFDLTVFPSYYEPWGYTPLESLMFSIPTVTTTLAGFGLWVKTYFENPGNGIAVIDRNDENESSVIDEMCSFIAGFTNLSAGEVDKARKKAHEISRIAMWDTLVTHYFDAYSFALLSSEARRSEPREFAMVLTGQTGEVRKPHQVPVWKDIFVQSDVPESMACLKELACNLWWSWNSDAENLFRRMDPTLWDSCGHNPRLLIEKIDYKRLKVLSEDDEFISEMNGVFGRFRQYMDRPDDISRPLVGYFSMEFGIHHCLKIYSGGLGILAGDYLKEASDSNVPLVAIGLLYRYGYFRQKLGPKGEQIAIYEAEDFSHLPICPVKDDEGNHMSVSLVWPGRNVVARIWEAKIGKVHLYLLDTDCDVNNPEDRSVTHHLYGGDNENRLKQELILGIGGIRALNKMGIKPDVFHSNEGHSAFIGFERLFHLINDHHLRFDEALEVVRSTTLFTTHTPVPAGHDAFDEDMLRRYTSHYHARLNISWDELMSLGRCETEPERKFNMSYLATRLSQEVNGVSKLHGEVSRGMFNKLWPGYLKDELFVGHVTNGVHHPTWLAPEWRDVYEEVTGSRYFDQTDRSMWEKIYNVDDKRVYEIRKELKAALFREIRSQLQTEMLERHVSPRKLLNISTHLDENVLTIGFARRFATYKRAHLLFTDLDRLDAIVNNPEKPVQFIYAGKAHPHDGGGQDLIRRINEISQMPRFAGKVLFLENYNMELGKLLVRGVDIWLNTPTRPLEASGTSGEKAVMNGTIHFSVLDGWWVEGYRAFAGWALPQKRTFANQTLQDDIDAETIYNMLQYEIIPAYYSFNEQKVPVEWVSLVKNTMVKIAPEFTMKRMIDDYSNKYYIPLWNRSRKVMADEYAVAKQLASWKEEMKREWDNIDVLSYSFEKPGENVYRSGRKYSAEVVLDVNNIPPESVGVEYVITRMQTDGEFEFVARGEFRKVSIKNSKCYFKAELTPEKAGSFFYGIRIFPKHDMLPHRQDFALLRWID
ncbi:MAG: alpha-glucan family phosphorylase [Bacteroidales bacterium]|nr:alpha-glucan family phosphorylase [Bacteroidales bacterium]